jgi:hypothetical protein
MKKLFLVFALGTLSFAQQLVSPVPPCQQMNCYTATTGNVSLSTAGTAATLQQPTAAPFQQLYGVKASVYCSVACVVTRSKNGTAATTTAGSFVQSPLQPFGTIAALALFYSASNAGSGTTIDIQNVQAGETRILDLSDVFLGPSANASYTLSIGSITGTVNITFYVGLK